MKHFLIICCLVAATNTGVYAQSANAAKPSGNTPAASQPIPYQKASVNAAASKSEFLAETEQLNTLIAQNKMELAKTKWNEINAHDQVEKSNLMNIMTSQQNAYANVIKNKDNLSSNKKEIHDGLIAFGA